jgi:hypothetical protein
VPVRACVRAMACGSGTVAEESSCGSGTVTEENSCGVAAPEVEVGPLLFPPLEDTASGCADDGADVVDYDVVAVIDDDVIDDVSSDEADVVEDDIAETEREPKGRDEPEGRDDDGDDAETEGSSGAYSDPETFFVRHRNEDGEDDPAYEESTESSSVSVGSDGPEYPPRQDRQTPDSDYRVIVGRHDNGRFLMPKKRRLSKYPRGCSRRPRLVD